MLSAVTEEIVGLIQVILQIVHRVTIPVFRCHFPIPVILPCSLTLPFRADYQGAVNEDPKHY